MHKTLLAALIAVASAFAIVITLGFALRPQFAWMSDRAFGTIAAVAIVALAVTVMAVLLRGRLMPAPDASLRAARIRDIKIQAARIQAAYREHKARRVAELRAHPDPTRRKYAPMVERGETWSDEQIAYNEDRNATATCPHLQPIEHAMRLAGIATHLQTASWQENSKPLLRIRADCCIDRAALERCFAIAEPLRYREGYQPERHPEDNPWAELACGACGSTIALVHSEWSRGTVPRFPARP